MHSGITIAYSQFKAIPVVENSAEGLSTCSSRLDKIMPGKYEKATEE